MLLFYTFWWTVLRAGLTSLPGPNMRDAGSAGKISVGSCFFAARFQILRVDSVFHGHLPHYFSN